MRKKVYIALTGKEAKLLAAAIDNIFLMPPLPKRQRKVLESVRTVLKEEK